jgi:anti-sigma factor RsiW
MSLREPGYDCPHRVDAAAAYVLGALEDHEPYREHLAECANCQADVAELQLAVNNLPASVPLAPAPEALVQRVLATVRSEAELLNAAGGQADQPPRLARWRSRRLSFITSGVALAAVAAAAIAIVLSGGSSVSERVIEGKVQASAAGAKAFLRQRGGGAELVVSRMTQPALGKVYEVWLSHGPGSPQPTDALFGVTGQGNGSVDVPENLHGVKEVMVTSEPLGGSTRPTSPPLIRILLPA